MRKKTKAKRAAKKSRTNKVTTRPRLKELTGLQKRFVDILHSMKRPCILKAFNLAGYKSTGKIGSVEANKTLNLPHVRAYYESLRQKATDKAVKMATRNIVTRRERQEFWSTTMKDTTLIMKDRLKASDLLGKSEADFKTKLIVEFDWRTLIKNGSNID